MNIEEYRAMKARELEEANKPQEPELETEVQETIQPEVTEPIAEEQIAPVEETLPTKIKIGDEEYEPEQLLEFKKGYARQLDYVEKMQELERQREELEYAVKMVEEIKSDPELYQRVATRAPELSPEAIKMRQLETELNNIKIQREVEVMVSKYPDFDAQKVAQVIEEKGITNLEDAYLLSVKSTPQPTIDVEALKAQLREELLKEIEVSSVSPSLIGQNGVANTPSIKEVSLSNEEARVANMMGLSPDDYIKWRDK